MNDYEKEFRHMYFDQIRQALGHDEWGVWFKQIDESIPKFIVDIYATSAKDYKTISDVIRQHLPNDMKFEIMPPHWDYNRFVDEMTN